MLVLMGPSFTATDGEYQRLSKVTGMVAYDLRARIKPGSWGLLKVLGDDAEAERFAAALTAEAFPVVTIARAVATDPERPIVALRALEIADQQLTLHLRERSMQIPVAALCGIVRGEAQVGRAGAARGAATAASSATFRAVVPDASELQVFREGMPGGNFEAFAAADLHFHSVTWIARIDARSFDFRALGIGAASPAAALDTLADRLALLAKVRVDRNARTSSINSFTLQAVKASGNASPSSPPSMSMSQRAKEVSGDDRFDPYSRVIGQAERLWAAQQAQLERPA
jgi:hypothetical protein